MGLNEKLWADVKNNSTQLADITQKMTVYKNDDYLLLDGLNGFTKNEFWNTEEDIVVIDTYVGLYKRSEPIPINAGDLISCTIWTGTSSKTHAFVIVDEDYNKLYTPVRVTSTPKYVIDEVVAPSNSAFLLITAYEASNKTYTVYTNSINNQDNKFKGLNIAIVGDSISTNGDTGVNSNAVEIEIGVLDVGVELSAYLTYYDVAGGLSLGGITFTSEQIGTEVIFTPLLVDIGKKIGRPNNYNPNNVQIWWENAVDALEFNPIPVTWSGASLTSHESTIDTLKTAHAWHEAQIRKCGIRAEGTMDRKAPDVIIIYRGVNDFSHLPYATLTSSYFDSVAFEYPITDFLNPSYGFKEGYALTISKLRVAYPKARIFLCTLPTFKRVSYTKFPTNNGTNTLPQYNNAIREIANNLGCELIEFDKAGITFENIYPRFASDSTTTPTHFNRTGHKLLGSKAINELINKY